MVSATTSSSVDLLPIVGLALLALVVVGTVLFLVLRGPGRDRDRE